MFTSGRLRYENASSRGLELAEELVARAQNGDREAFGLLVEAHYDFIRNAAWRWTGNAADADDIAQEVCLKLARMIKGFRGEGRFRTWLYSLTLNAVRDQARKASRESRKAMAYFVDPAVRTAAEDGDGTLRLWEAVRALPAKQCDAVMLVYAEGLSHSAAADVLGCSESTISWHVHEARKRLRVLLGRELAQGEEQ
jgi:RNA polymerase sigma-70 factor, ECF subfamily